jgi:hypothetical protein
LGAAVPFGQAIAAAVLRLSTVDRSQTVIEVHWPNERRDAIAVRDGIEGPRAGRIPHRAPA